MSSNTSRSDDVESTSSLDETELQFLQKFELIICNIAWCTLILSILGIITNLVSIYIYTHRSMRSPVNVLLAGLSAIDLVLSACCIPSFVIPGWVACNKSFEWIMAYCVFYFYPITMMAQSASVFTFLVIAFDRWIAVCHPLKARWSSITRSYRALITVVIAAVTYNMIRYFEHELQFEDDKVIVVQLLKNTTTYPYYMPIYYVGMYLITHFIVPFSILISVNILMIMSIVKARRQRLMLGRKQKSEHKTTIMMGVVVFVFVLCNTLPFILNFVEAVDHSFFSNDQTMIIGWALLEVCNLLVVVNTSTTAFIYYACSQKYRNLFLWTSHRMCCGFRYLPFDCCPDWNANMMNGGYSIANASMRSSMATPVSRRSFCMSEYLPDPRRRAISDTRDPNYARLSGMDEKDHHRRRTVVEVITGNSVNADIANV